EGPRVAGRRRADGRRRRTSRSLAVLGQTPLQLDHRETGARCSTAVVAPVGRGAGQCLGLVLDRQNAVADREPVTSRQVLQATRALGADVVVMRGLTADHAAE